MLISIGERTFLLKRQWGGVKLDTALFASPSLFSRTGQTSFHSLFFPVCCVSWGEVPGSTLQLWRDAWQPGWWEHYCWSQLSPRFTFNYVNTSAAGYQSIDQCVSTIYQLHLAYIHVYNPVISQRCIPLVHISPWVRRIKPKLVRPCLSVCPDT